jgi:dTDP-4-amino-4,6-dideoxygalactose transaminase
MIPRHATKSKGKVQHLCNNNHQAKSAYEQTTVILREARPQIGISLDLLSAMINVTKSYLPPLEQYVEQLKRVWANGWLTNNGELVQELETRLKEYLGVKHLFFVSNGTIALQLAIKALALKKEIITTPFSYVATTNAILWEHCTPVFVDIHPSTFCIDAGKIEAAITERTEAILAVHVYGIPCDVKRIEKIAQRYNLKVIYDAAHAFGTTNRGESVAVFGDVSTFSFHATKIFHTVEGGAVITNDEEIAHKLFLYRSFGHLDDDYFSVGINGKNSEFHAAMGLCNLPRVTEFIAKRRELVKEYDAILRNVPLLRRPQIPPEDSYNYAYYPVAFPSELLLLKTKERLHAHGINTRRYFYPALNTLPFANGSLCPYAESIAPRILCLPLYVELELEDVRSIAHLVRKEVLSALTVNVETMESLEA